MAAITSYKCFLFIGALLGFISVAAGAFGAHALKQKLSPDLLAVFEVACRYQMYHALAICLTAWAMSSFNSSLFASAGWLFFLGTIIFSGSLYILVLSGARFWGAFTPIGGVILLIGWLCFAIGALRI